MPSPGELHGVICAWIAHLLWMYVIKHGKGRVVGNDAGLLVERDPDTLRGPDLMLFLDTLALAQLSRRYTVLIPALVIEVSSPEDRPGKVNRRISQYLKRGVQLVWLVDPEERTVTVYRPGKELYILNETDELTGDDVLPDWRCQVVDFFKLPGATALAQ